MAPPFAPRIPALNVARNHYDASLLLLSTALINCRPNSTYFTMLYLYQLGIIDDDIHGTARPVQIVLQRV
jgi:hypothetical protein